jgi:peroxiredoxin
MGMALTALWVLVGTTRTGAVEIGEPAPGFKLPSTHGVDISLSDFKGKKWIFLEFYGGDFHPT